MRIFCTLNLIFLLFFCFPCHGQFLDAIRELKSLESEPDEVMRKMDSLIYRAESIDYDSSAYLYRIYANWMYDYDISKASTLAKKARQIAYGSNANDSLFLYKINLDLGYFQKRSYEYTNAIRTYKEVLLWTDSDRNAFRVYNQIAQCYEKLNDYYRAFENYKIASRLLENTNKNSKRLMILNYNMSIALARQNTKASQLLSGKYAQKADSMCTSNPQLEGLRFIVKFNHAEIYNHDLILDTLLSSALYEEAYTMVKSAADTAGMIQTLYGLGTLFNSTNQQKSRNYHYEALNLIDELDSVNLHLNWYALGKTLAYEGNYSESSQKLIQSLLYLTGEDFSIPQNLLENEKYFFQNADKLIYNLPLLGEVYLKWYETTNDTSLLKKSLGCFGLADKILDYQKANSKDFLSRLHWRKESTDLYGKALRACYLLSDYDRALYFMEKNKALLLMEDIAQREIKASSNQYPYLFLKEETLKKKIVSTITQIKEKQKSSEGDELLQTKADLETELSLLQDSIYGYDKSLRYDPEQLKIDDVQESLDDHEFFIEYHMSIDDGQGIYSNNEKGYVLVIGKHTRQIFEIDQLSELYISIEKLTSLMKSPLHKEEDVDAYNSLSFSLYQKLIPEIDLQNSLKGRKLTIAPDHYLHFVPFEALSTSPAESEFLIKDTEISYVYSYTFGENNVRDIPKADNTVLAFAPQYFAAESLSPLLHTKEELEAIEEDYKGDFYVENKATKSTFKDRAKRHGIIHLATHAYSSTDSTPWISFYDEKMSLDELYLIESNASLVVLSACDTNIGKLEVGEGAMSLARGFFYGGTQSVVSTLWNVDDRSTQAIVKDFYVNLRKGQDKSKALHNAKLNYLRENSLSELSPYYWSSLVLLGDPSPMDIQGGAIHFYIYSFLFLTILLVYLGFRRRFQKV